MPPSSKTTCTSSSPPCRTGSSSRPGPRRANPTARTRSASTGWETAASCPDGWCRTSCWLEASPGNHPRPGPQMEAGMVLRLSLRAPAIFSRSFLLRQALKEPSASGFTMRHPLRTCRALFQRTLEPCRTQRPGFVPYPRKTGRWGICAHHCNFKKSSASHTVPTMESCRYRALRKRSDFVRSHLFPPPATLFVSAAFFNLPHSILVRH